MKSISRKLVQKVYEAMKDGVQRTCPEIADLCATSGPYASRAMHELRISGQAHIADWRAVGISGWVKVWKCGHGEDSPKPMALTKEEKDRRYQERRREGKIGDRNPTPFTPFRDPLVALFFGPSQFSGEVSAVKPRVIQQRW